MRAPGASPARGVAPGRFSRLWHSPVRLPLFRSAAGSCGQRISPNDVHPALAWLRCHLLATHDHAIRSASGRVFLQCQHCGARSRGWVLGPERYRTPPRPDTALAGSISADPFRAAAGTAPAWPRLTDGVFNKVRRLALAPARALQSAELEARALGAAASARMHASRDPPAS